MTSTLDHASNAGMSGRQWKDKSDMAGQMEAQIRKVRSRMASVRHSVAVMSGKGGVGKSTVTAGLAITLARLGFSVGVCDLDINGPSIPTLLGVSGKIDFTNPEPVVGPEGIKIMSSDFLLENQTMPIRWKGPVQLDAIWRGSLEMTVTRELLADIEWGELDIMLFDLPPGTTDKAVVVTHLLGELSGAIVVTLPSFLSHHVVQKAVVFARELDMPLLGIVENMSHFVCPTCNTVTDLFGAGENREESIMGLPVLGRLPFDRRALINPAGAIDAGQFNHALAGMASNLLQALDYKSVMAANL